MKQLVHCHLVLSAMEEKEFKKIDKKLKDIAKLFEKGVEHLDRLQLEKTKQKAELEQCIVFQKVRAGYARPI